MQGELAAWRTDALHPVNRREFFHLRTRSWRRLIPIDGAAVGMGESVKWTPVLRCTDVIAHGQRLIENCAPDRARGIRDEVSRRSHAATDRRWSSLHAKALEQQVGLLR